VRGVERVGKLPRDPSRFVEWDRTVHQTIRQGRPFDELQHQRARVPADVGRAVVNAVNGADVLMIQRGEEVRFTFESREPIGVARKSLGQDLDGDVAAERGIAGTLDLAHATRPEAASDLECADPRPRCERHLLR
jgi:hypothetical protein